MMWLDLLPCGERSGSPSDEDDRGMVKRQRDKEGAE
jgi:hypothetical protein